MTGKGLFWLASYPKSGNTWVRVMLACLKAGGQKPDLSCSTSLCPNSASLRWVEGILDIPTDDMTPKEHRAMRAEAHRVQSQVAQSSPWLKVHDLYDSELFPTEVTAGTILIVRDPRDVAPSLADHMDVSLDVAIECMNRSDFAVSRTDRELRPQAQQWLGAWSANVLSWHDEAPGPKLLLRYEDMLDDPLMAVERLARFVGLSVSPDIVAATVETSSFGTLQAAETAVGFSERIAHQARFFRQGRAGGWRDVLSPDQAGRLWAEHAAVMTRLGYQEDG